MEDNNKEKKVVDLDDYIVDAAKKTDELGENPSYEEQGAFVMGLSVEEYRKKIEEMAAAMGLTVEEYREWQAKLGEDFERKQQEFLKTGNPVMVTIDSNTGEIIGEFHRTGK